MKVSIITPSYNQVRYIERTIQSVLNQNYPDLEYIIMDGGSTDGTVEILKKYGSKIIWKSEKDNGQSDAINKGLKMATGDIVAYLNSDDAYEPGAIKRVIDFFEKNPDKKWAYGKCKIIDENDNEIRKPITFYKNILLKKYSYAKLLSENFISQPATFWKREIHAEIGFFDESEHYCMDYEFWLRIGQKYPAGVINDYLANFRYHTSSKSGEVNRKQFQDELRIAKKYGENNKLSIVLHYANYWKIVMIYRLMNFFNNREMSAKDGSASGGKKIIFLHPHFLKPGGASNVVLEFASRLKNVGVPNVIITTNVNDNVIGNYKNLEIINLKCFSTGNIFFWLIFPYFYLKLKNELKKYPSDTPLFCHSLAIYWGAAYKFLNKKVLTINYFHDLGMPYTDSDAEINGLSFIPRVIASIMLPILRCLNYKMIDKADYLISNSQTSANFIEKKYSRRVDLIAYPGVDINIFKPSYTKEDYVYTLGRLEKIKNINLIIRSFALYCKKFKDQKLKLIIIGTGIEKNKLEELSKIQNIEKRVIFMGNCNQKKVAFIASNAKAGIFLCPNESFGLAAVESMACGTPVIGVNYGGIAETVINEQMGLLSTLNEDEIANKINSLLIDKQRLEILSKNARSRAEKNYDWDKSIELLRQFFIKL